MLREETNQLMKILSVTYPNTYKDFTDAQKVETMQVYFDFFGEYPTPVVVQSLRNYIKKNQYPPTIAGLQEQIELLLNKGDTNIELWNAILKAASSCLWNLQEQYNKLPKPCQIWLRDAEGLKNLAMIDTETLNTVTRGQFLKTIGEISEREEAQDALPEPVRNAITQGFIKQLGG
jgi:hypothetical protein